MPRREGASRGGPTTSGNGGQPLVQHDAPHPLELDERALSGIA
jgi:hypothetical protein